VVLARLAALGLDERAVTELMPKLPGQLTTAQRRLIALTRAMLMEPDLMIYEDLIAGLERESVSRWLAATSDFQRAAPGRASLYLCPDDAVSERIRADRVVRLD
jgi:ABC-type polar amino acid transport system ATPase subunit